MGIAQADTIVVLNDETTFTSADGCTYIRILDPEVAAGLTAGEYDEPDDLPEGSIQKFDIEALYVIAEAAQSVLNAPDSGFAKHRLASVIESAGFVVPGFYTDLYTADSNEDDEA